MIDRLEASDESPEWRTKSGNIKLSDMSESYLQAALKHAQNREFYFFNRMQIFTQKIEEIQKEAENRGIELKLKDGNQFFKNNKKHKLIKH